MINISGGGGGSPLAKTENREIIQNMITTPKPTGIEPFEETTQTAAPEYKTVIIDNTMSGGAKLEGEETPALNNPELAGGGENNSLSSNNENELDLNIDGIDGFEEIDLNDFKIV